jgi:hypothetical protein
VALLWLLSVFAIDLRSGREGVVVVRQAGPEITDDRAEKARREQPGPDGTGRILTDGRQLSLVVHAYTGHGACAAAWLGDR